MKHSGKAGFVRALRSLTRYVYTTQSPSLDKEDNGTVRESLSATLVEDPYPLSNL